MGFGRCNSILSVSKPDVIVKLLFAARREYGPNLKSVIEVVRLRSLLHPGRLDARIPAGDGHIKSYRTHVSWPGETLGKNSMCQKVKFEGCQ